jgi:hypothetical protein
MFLCLLAGCAGPAAAPVQHAAMEPYLGLYRGSFDSALTEDPQDDLNHNPCETVAGESCHAHHEPLADILLELRRTPDGAVTLAFYRTREALAAGRHLDLLGASCGTRLGPLAAIEQNESDAEGHTAVFSLTADNRLCLGKLRPTSRHWVRVELHAGPARAARVVIDRNVRDANYLYVVEDGIRRRVRIDLDNTIRQDAVTRYRVCIEDDLGEYDRCVLTDRQFRSFALPVPVPGGAAVNYTWWQELRPRLRRTQGQYRVEQYHGRFDYLEPSGS